jgi:integrase
VGKIDELISPQYVDELTSQTLSQLYGKMMAYRWGKDNNRSYSEATVQSHLRTILAALSWAAEQQMIDAVPKLRVAKQSQAKQRKMKGRPITGEEHERMLAACKLERPDDWRQWRRLLRLLWWSGLRLNEALNLSWDWADPFSLDLECRFPRYVIDGDSQKSGKDELLPIAPEFARILRFVPVDRRHGSVLKWAYSESWTCKQISLIGKRAGVKVTAKKFASAHDYRRSFGTRWASRLTPADLQKLMRHATITTTMDFYVAMPANDLGSRLYAAVKQPVSQKKGSHVNH